MKNLFQFLKLAQLACTIKFSFRLTNNVVYSDSNLFEHNAYK